MNKKGKFIFHTLLVFLVIFSVGANQKAFALNSNIPDAPKEDIFVQDYANMIDSNSKNQLLQMSKIARDKGTAELAIVTMPSLNGDDLDEYANTLFRTWGIGNKDSNNGILILLVQDTKKVRVEVGKGLEGTINDAKSGDTTRVMTRYFKEGKFGEGLVSGHNYLMNIISPNAKEATITNDSHTAVITNGSNAVITNTNNTSKSNNQEIPISTILVIIFVLFLVVYIVSNKSSRRRRYIGSRGSYSYSRSDNSSDSCSTYSSSSDSFGGGSSDGGGADGGW